MPVKGGAMSEEAKEKLRAHFAGGTLSEEHKEKIRQAMKGVKKKNSKKRKQTEATKQRIKAKLKGRKCSPETRARMALDRAKRYGRVKEGEEEAFIAKWMADYAAGNIPPPKPRKKKEASSEPPKLTKQEKLNAQLWANAQERIADFDEAEWETWDGMPD